MKNSSQMITARQGNRIMILEIFSAAAMFLPQIALQKSYHSGIVVVVMASVMAGIYLWIVDHAARGVSIENVLKRYRFAAIIYYVRFLLNGAFFIYVFCILQKISSPRQINIFYWITIASSGLSDESGRFNKKRQSNGRNFLVCITTADLRTDLEYGKSFMG